MWSPAATRCGSSVRSASYRRGCRYCSGPPPRRLTTGLQTRRRGDSDRPKNQQSRQGWGWPPASTPARSSARSRFGMSCRRGNTPLPTHWTTTFQLPRHCVAALIGANRPGVGWPGGCDTCQGAAAVRAARAGAGHLLPRPAVPALDQRLDCRASTVVADRPGAGGTRSGDRIEDAAVRAAWARTGRALPRLAVPMLDKGLAGSGGARSPYRRWRGCRQPVHKVVGDPGSRIADARVLRCPAVRRTDGGAGLGARDERSLASRFENNRRGELGPSGSAHGSSNGVSAEPILA